MKKETQVTLSMTETLLTKFQDFSEADFTKNVLIPLFRAMGYTVDYYGGPGEGGKDLIAWRNAEFGASDLVAIQVKKTKPTAVAADTNSFSGIITQLQQANEKEISLITGAKSRPNKVYFITPYQIDVRALETRFEAMQNLSLRGVRVLDGQLVAKELQERLPKLAEAICGEEFLIKNDLLSNISNEDLLSALNYSKQKDIAEFYCDLDFGVGRVTSKLFFEIEFTPMRKTFSFPKSGWGAIKSVAERIKSQTGVDVVIPSLDVVTDAYEKQYILWQSEQNQAIQKEIWKIVDDIESLVQFVLDEFSETISSTSAPQDVFAVRAVRELTEEEHARLELIKIARRNIESGSAKLSGRSDITQNEFTEIRTMLSSVEEQLKNLPKDAPNNTFLVSLSPLSRNLKDLNHLYDSLARCFEKRVVEPTYQFDIDGNAIVKELGGYKEYVSKGIGELSNKKLRKEEIKAYFLECQKIFELVGIILDERAFSDCAGVNPSQKYSLPVTFQRIHMPIREVFSTGIHCAVYGEAGAGKSTTLFRYASYASSSDAVEEITLFLPLTRLLANLREGSDDDHFSPLERMEREIAKFLNSEKRMQDEDVIKFLRSKRKVVFIFDGVDEVIKSAPWVVDAIHSLGQSFSGCQIILSSRSSGSYLDSTNYLALTLLPFTDEQVGKFIDGWFSSDAKKAAQVKTHLQSTSSLKEIVRNPLLATVLCVLAENNVPLPAGELSMYAERIKLLLGHYDIHKKTKRLKSHHTVLETVARKLAFQLHDKNLRSASPENLELFAIKSISKSSNGIPTNQIKTAVRELIDPCNVLVPMTDDGDFGFGHLRFQEYLCALELCQNRGIDLLPLLSSSWWRSVLVLFARLTDDIGYIISDVVEKQVNMAKYQETLNALIATKNKKERPHLRSLIAQYVELDELEYGSYDFNEDEYDHRM